MESFDDVATNTAGAGTEYFQRFYYPRGLYHNLFVHNTQNVVKCSREIDYSVLGEHQDTEHVLQ